MHITMYFNLHDRICSTNEFAVHPFEAPLKRTKSCEVQGFEVSLM
jgi:hypothetical protein